MPITQKKVVALLDVDNTLIFGNSEQLSYNNNLIETLIENNVKDIYLFTSMTLKQSGVSERMTLVEYLSLKGLTVHGVICAADLVWKKDKAQLKRFYQELNVSKANNLFSKDEFKSLYDFSDAVCGEGFKAVTEGIEGWSDDDARMYQDISCLGMKYLNDNSTSEHKDAISKTEKSYLYQMFVNKKPEWVDAVIFIDDAMANISAVEGMNKELQPTHLLFTLHNEEKKEYEKSFYQQFIQSCLEIINTLLNVFNSYKSGRRFTHSTRKNEILERFGSDLIGCKTKDELNQLKETFEKSNPDYQTINQHRFSIWSKEKTRSAVIYDSMIENRLRELK